VIAGVDALPNEKACLVPLSFSVVSSLSSSITTASDVLLSAGLPKNEDGPGVIENPSDDVFAFLPNPLNAGLLVSEVVFVVVVVVDLSDSLAVLVTEAKGDGDAAATA